MKVYTKIMEWLYLALAVVFIVEIYTNWNIDRNKAYLSCAMGVLAIVMFFFKRKLRIRNSQD